MMLNGSKHTLQIARHSARCLPRSSFVGTSRWNVRRLFSEIQEPYSQSESHQDTVDPSLFELESRHYAIKDQPTSRYSLAPTAVQNRVALHSLYVDGHLDKALKTLRELQALQAEIQPYAMFAAAAVDTAQQDDFEGALRWLKLVPPRKWLTKDPLKGGARKEVRARLNDLLRILEEKGQFNYVWQTLLVMANMGYIVANKSPTQRYDHVSHVFHWLMSRTNIQSSWLRSFWSHFLRQVIWSQAGDRFRKAQIPRASVLHESRRQSVQGGQSLDVEVVLRQCFNASLKAFILTQNYEEAVRWAKMDAMFSSAFLPGVHVIQGSIWNALMHAVVEEEATIDSDVREQVIDLQRRLEGSMKKAQEKQDSGTAKKMPRWKERVQVRISRLALDGSAILNGRKLPKQSLEFDDFHEKIEILRQNGRHKELASLLNDTLEEHRMFPRSTAIARLSRIEDDDVKAYLAKLNSRRANRPQLLRAKMIELNKEGKTLDSLRLYFAGTKDEQMSSLVSRILTTEERTTVFTDPSDESDVYRVDFEGSLVARSYLSSVAMRSLVQHVKYDTQKLKTLYIAWIGSHDHAKVVKAEAESSERQKRGGTAIEQDAYPAPPHRDHFVTFLRFLPRALTLRAREEQEAPYDEHTVDWHNQAKTWTMRIADDAQRFNAFLRMDMMNLMLDTLIRSLNVHGDDYEEDVARIKTLLDSVEFGGFRRRGDSQQPGDQDDDDNYDDDDYNDDDEKRTPAVLRATPLTYAYVIRAYLSVQLSRGGPMLDEAEAVYEAYQADHACQRKWDARKGRYNKAIEHARNALNDVRGDVLRFKTKQALQGHGIS